MNNNIGYCESCGRIDHYRVHGLCATCIQKTKTVQAKSEQPLGYEAANIATINNYKGLKNAAHH